MFTMSPPPTDWIEPDPNSSPGKLCEEFRQALAPTKEELEYVCTEEEQKLLCRHFEVKVDMTKFNITHHFYRIFKKRGSLENRTKESTLRLLMKAYKRYKNNPRHVYTEGEIKGILREDWEHRKAHFVRHLEYVKNPDVTSSSKGHEEESDDSNSNLTVVENTPQQDPGTLSSQELPSFLYDHMLAFKGMCAQQENKPSETETSQLTESENQVTQNSLLRLQGEMINATMSDQMLIIDTEELEMSAEDFDHEISTEMFNDGKQITSTQKSDESGD